MSFMRYFNSSSSDVCPERSGKQEFGLVLSCLLFVLAVSPSIKAKDVKIPPAFEGPADEQQYVPGEVLVISVPAPRHNKRPHLQSKHNYKQVLHVKLPEGKSVKQAIAEQQNKKDPRIVRVEPNYRVRILGVPNDPLFGQMWALKNTGRDGGTAGADIDAVSAWDINTGSDNVVVAVIDTGIDTYHPDLRDNIWTNADEIPNNGRDDDRNGYIDDVHGYDFVKDDNNPRDEFFHGTHVAGTIAARGNNRNGVTGINWRCKLMACRFLDEDGSGTTSDAIDAIRYAVANGADILSNSWGGPGYSQSLEEAIDYANDHGVLFVAAAGNDGLNTDVYPNYPSGYAVANVISVAATDNTDSLAYFSNYGRRSVHLAAPGVDILSTFPTYQTVAMSYYKLSSYYETISGTSMATPHVAGVAALLLAQNPSMTLNELKARLIWTGDQIEALGSKTITGRRLNAYNALAPVPALTVLTPNTQTTWVQGFDWPIQWSSVGGANTVDIYLLKAGAVVEQLADDVPNTGEFSWSIPDTVAVGSDYRISINDGVNSDQSDVNFAVSDTMMDYFTQLFSSDTGTFDISKNSLLLTPDASTSRYNACLKEITGLPVNPAGGTNLGLDDDDSRLVTLGSNVVQFYGTRYNSFYVSSNGCITFDSPDNSYIESEAAHFSLKRISGLFCDLDPSVAGSVTVKKLDDRVAVTWQGVPEYGGTLTNTFQIEMFYEGSIRLSWLTVNTRYGLAGISEGLGTPFNFQQSDISEYVQCQPLLESVEVTGPEDINEQSSAQLTCTAHYDDGSTRDVTTTTQTVWTADSNFASVDQAGLLTTGDVNTYQRCTVTADFNVKSAGHTLIIKDSPIHNIAIQKCTVRAGLSAGLDSIYCSGRSSVTADDLNDANHLTVRIYSGADNYLVYQKTIDMNSFTRSRNTYTYKYRVIPHQPGSINLLRFDVSKNTFYLRTKNTDLTGLACPVYLMIDLGTYTGMGVANESIVNGRKLIPVQLLSGYADTLLLTKIKPKISAIPSSDQLSAKGTFTVGDDSNMAQGLTIIWGSQTFTIPGDQFLAAREGLLKTDYNDGNGASIYANFNFIRCTFQILIKKTTITTQYGTVDFGLTFGNYNKTNEVRF
jgi:subtilisin family serine protease